MQKKIINNEREYNDVLVMDCKAKNNSKCIVKAIINNITDKFVISIGGCSGSRKSEISLYVQDKLLDYGIISKIMHLDNWYNVSPNTRNEYREKTGIIGRKEMDKVGIYNFIADFKENLVHIYAKVLIVEGLYALDQYSNFRIHLEGTVESTKEFRLMRKKETQNEFRNKVLEIEFKECDSLKDKADLII